MSRFLYALVSHSWAETSNENEPLYNDDSRVTLERLGQPFLTSSEASDIAGSTYQAFREARDTFVRERGAALAREELIEDWTDCGFRVRSVRRFGPTVDGPLRSRFAELRWVATGAASLSGGGEAATIAPDDVLAVEYQHPGAVALDTTFRAAFRQGRLSPETSVRAPCKAELPEPVYLYPYRGQWRIAWDGLPVANPRPAPRERSRPW